MKKPLINYIDRQISYAAPDSLSASRVSLTIAKAHLCREIGNDMTVKWTMKQLEKLSKLLN